MLAKCCSPVTPINKFLCGMFSLDHTLSTMLRYTKRTFDFNSNGVHEYYAVLCPLWL